MSPLVRTVTDILSVGAIALLAGCLGLLALRLARRPATERVLDWVQRFGLAGALTVACLGVAGSLFYSEIAGFAPCLLCWWQRIFFYPLVPILGIAVLRRSRSIAPYALTLTLPGLAIALYHVFLQYGTLPDAPCGVTGVSCGVRYFNTFGFVTLPLLSFAGFAALTALLLTQLRRRNLDSKV